MCYKLRKKIHSNSSRNSLFYLTRSSRAKNSLDVAYFKCTVIINIYDVLLTVYYIYIFNYYYLLLLLLITYINHIYLYDLYNIYIMYLYIYLYIYNEHRPLHY